jgi:hypothetical protein
LKLLLALGYLLLALSFNACGYKPASIYTKNVLGDKIYVDLDVDINNPQNSVLIKDALNEAIINKFKAQISNQKNANTILKIKLKSVQFLPIQYDEQGFIVAYKTNVSLQINYAPKKTIISKGSYDFPIEKDSIISNNKKFEAIKIASSKALASFISQISLLGQKGS